MNSRKTKGIVQGAMIAALFGALSLFNTYSGGLIDSLICWGMVVPIAWYGYQYSLKENIIVFIVSMIIILIFGIPSFIISSFSSCLIGIYLGECLKRKAKKEVIILGVLVVCIINNVLIYQVFSGLLGIDVVSEFTVTYNEILKMKPDLNISLDFMLSLIPLTILLMSALEMYVILLICQLIFHRLKIEFPENFHIATLHFSKRVGVILLIVLLLGLALKYIVKIDYIMVDYIYLIAFIGFVVQGFAFGNYYAIVNQYKWLMLLLFVLFFIPGGLYLYFGLGFFDIFSDLRGKVLYNSKN